MTSYWFTVVVSTDTLEHAQQVVTERLGHDEDYGFEYTIDWLSDGQERAS